MASSFLLLSSLSLSPQALMSALIASFEIKQEEHVLVLFVPAVHLYFMHHLKHIPAWYVQKKR